MTNSVFQTCPNRITTMRGSIRGMPAVEAGAVFFRRGEPKLRASKRVGQDVVVNRMQIVQEFSAYTVPDSRWLCLHIPLSWRGSYKFNGYEFQPSEAILTECPSGYFTRGADRDALTLGFRKQVFSEAVAALLNRPEYDFSISQFVFRPGRGLMNFIASQISNTSLDNQLNSLLTPDDERRLIDLLAMEFIAHLVSLNGNIASKSRANDVVADALAVFVNNRNRIPSLSELCAASGVGPTRLFQCFEEIQGMSPYKYMRLMKLDEAYFLLSDRQNPPRSVKDVALSLGYEKPGRFAEQFKKQFGKLPSQVFYGPEQRAEADL